MKLNHPVTGVDHSLRDDDAIISTTNLKGMIESANSDFIRISGFSIDELVGKSHNVVRHPDMPPQAFANLWDTLKQNKPWIGVVKNRCKNGDHYWVDAFVSPIYENGQVTGYQSVRGKPERALVERVERLYARLLAGQPIASWWRDRSLTARIFAGIVAISGAVLLGLAGFAKLAPLAALMAWVVSAALAYGVAAHVTRPLADAARASKQIVDNPLSQYIYFGAANDLTQLLCAQRMLQARLRVAAGRIGEFASRLEQTSQNTAATAEQTHAGIRKHQSETDQVATAMNEMSATVHDVARNATETAQATRDANTESQLGQDIVRETIAAIERLSSEVEKAAGVIKKLEKDSENIGSVVDVIKNIAEQTNLLALNAAIEAARAGEQGRGFAVVADEVRTLASRTQQSTQEIQHMIEGLQGATRDAARVMEDGRNQAALGVKQVAKTGQSLTRIADAVERIAGMSAQIATASEQQSAVAEEINRNILNITHVVEETAAGASNTAVASEDLLRLSGGLKALLKQCFH